MGIGSVVGLNRLGSIRHFGIRLSGAESSSVSPEGSSGSDGGVLEIHRKELKTARADPRMHQLVADAEEQERRLEAEGRIHP